MKKSYILVMLCALVLSGCGNQLNDSSADSEQAKNSLSHEGYSLEQVVVLSRHNIRSPLSSKGSALDTMTPHEWVEWSSKPSDLSVRGGTLETEMGQYFRKWLEQEGLFPEDYMPTEEEVRIYANAKQRTIATAQFFKAGLLPVSNNQVEYHAEYNNMDPVFNPKLTFMSDEYRDDVEAQVTSLFGEKINGLSDNYELLSKVIDVEESDDWKAGNFTGFVTDDVELSIEEDAEPAMTGSLKTACSISDALVLQYYETDAKDAAFGEKLSTKQWEDIAEIKDVYEEVLFATPLLATNIAHPLLLEIENELSEDGRRFTFLCGHDSNIVSVLSALSVEEYDLQDAIEKTTPIGCKIVFCKWVDSVGKEYVSVDMVYQTVDQLKNMPILDMDNPPAIVELNFNGLNRNQDGLYEASEFENHLRQAIEEYEILFEQYEIENAA